MQKHECRLCLDTFVEHALSIDNPELKSQLEKVFNFSIEHREGCSTTVCQGCSYTISEFFQYSEKVRLNQQQLCAVDRHSLPTDGKLQTVVDLKIEPTSKEDDDLKEEEGSLYEAAGFSSDESEPEPTIERRKCRRSKKKQPSKCAQGRKPKPSSFNTKSKEQLEEEDKKLSEFYPMRCDLCGHTASDFSSLKSHFRTAHETTGYIMCCKKKLVKRIYLLEHLMLHLNPDAYRCEKCNKSYKNKFYLSVHQTKVHGTEADRPFKCDRCPQSYAKAYQLRGHLTCHEKAPCPHCDRLLANKIALNVHITNVHSDKDRRMICDACGQEFLTKGSFERHVKEHKGIEVVKKLQCQICRKWLMGERVLQNHILFLHGSKDQSQVCDICQQHYPNSRALASHKRSVHVAEKYECEFCGKKFKQAVNLKEHRTQHTGERLYSCEHCEATMNSKANLYMHTKKHHPVEWAAKKHRTDVGPSTK